MGWMMPSLYLYLQKNLISALKGKILLEIKNLDKPRCMETI